MIGLGQAGGFGGWIGVVPRREGGPPLGRDLTIPRQIPSCANLV